MAAAVELPSPNQPLLEIANDASMSADPLSVVSHVQDGEVKIRSREYQLEMFEASMKKNIIVAMDTGSGKTHIAILRIMEEIHRSPGKLVWFLAPQVALCMQQFEVMKKHLPAVNVKILTGADNVEHWSNQKVWNAFLDGVQVVVSTHAVLADALTHGFVTMAKLALLVFDEGTLPRPLGTVIDASSPLV